MMTRDWVSVPPNVMLDVFTRLNYRDRVNLEATCTAWRSLCLWTSLDLRSLPSNSRAAAVLFARCPNLMTLKVQEQLPKDLDVSPLRRLEIEAQSWESRQYESLEVLDLVLTLRWGADGVLRSIAPCCPKLKSLRLQASMDHGTGDILSLQKFCPGLVNLALDHSLTVDEDALASLTSLRYLSIKRCRSINWKKATQAWKRFWAIDISHTNAQLKQVKSLLESPYLKVLCVFSEHVTRTQEWCDISGGSTFLLDDHVKRLPFTDTSDPELFHWAKRAILNNIHFQWNEKLLHIEKQKALLRLLRTQTGITHDVLERSFRPLDPEVLLELAAYSSEDYIRLRAAQVLMNHKMPREWIQTRCADRAANTFLSLARSRRNILKVKGILGLQHICSPDTLVRYGAIEVLTDLAVKGIPEAIPALTAQSRVSAQKLYDSGSIRALTQRESLKGNRVVADVLWEFLDVCRPQSTISVGKDGALVLHLDGETYHAAAGTLCCFALVPEQLKAIVEQGGVRFLLKSLRTSQDEATKFEAALILATVMCQTSDLQMLKLITPSIYSYQAQLTSKAREKVRKLRLRLTKENGWQVLLKMLENGPPDVHVLVLVAAQVALDGTRLCDLGAQEVMRQITSSSFFQARKMAKVMSMHGEIVACTRWH